MTTTLSRRARFLLGAHVPLPVLILAMALGACDRPAPGPAAGGTAAAKATVTRAASGALPDGTAVESFALTNASGASVTVLDYGGLIVSISVPDRSGKLADVVLGYDRLDGYLGDNSHYGAIVGRYANRIGGARFALDGRTYELAANNGPSSLHGGRNGFDRTCGTPSPSSATGPQAWF